MATQASCAGTSLRGTSVQNAVGVLDRRSGWSDTVVADTDSTDEGVNDREVALRTDAVDSAPVECNAVQVSICRLQQTVGGIAVGVSDKAAEAVDNGKGTGWGQLEDRAA